MKVECGVVSKVGRDFGRTLSDLDFVDLEGIEVTDRTTRIDIKEMATSASATIKDFGGDLKVSSVPEDFFSARVFMISTQSSEVPIGMLEAIRNRFNGTIALDIQGFTRPVLRQNQSLTWSDVTKKKPRSLKRLMKNVDVLKCNEVEFNLLTDGGLTPKGLREISDLGPRTIIVTLGKRGSAIFAKGRMARFSPDRDLALSHTVGAGDKFFALFLAYLIKTNDAFISAKLANENIARFIADDSAVFGRMPDGKVIR
jgi:sugar/nucleoside kinase (ribokinase family)